MGFYDRAPEQITLRDYQEAGTSAALDFFLNGDPKERPIVVAPTGAGKSIYIGHLANELNDKGGILVLQPSKELLEQNFAKYKLYGGRASVYSASLKQKEVGHVTFATIGSVKNKAHEFPHVKFILIDECHLVPPKEDSMYVTFLSQMTHCKVLGLTATPFRLKTYNHPFTGQKFSQLNLLTRERPRFFNRFLHVTQIKELYAKKFLSPIKYLEIPWDNERLVPNSTGAEFDEEAVDRELKLQKVYEKIPPIIQQSIDKGRKHRIVYVRNVEKAEELAKIVPDSAAVHSGTDKKDREKILEDFKAGKIKTVFNVGVLTIGFDFPALDTIIIARPTMSMALYMQMIGRGIRLHPGKTDCAVVDMCGNMERFGQIENIEYTTDPSGKWVVLQENRVLSGVPMTL